ncbi:hypothetical protein D3C72_1400220 [compost metagenome]
MVGLHFVNLARHRRIGAEPAFEMMAIRAVGTKSIDVLAIDILSTVDRPMVQRCDQHHLFLEHRHPVQGRVQHGPIDEGCHQAPGQHAFDHRPGRPRGKVQFDLAVLLVIGSKQSRDAYRCGAFQ